MEAELGYILYNGTPGPSVPMLHPMLAAVEEDNVFGKLHPPSQAPDRATRPFVQDRQASSWLRRRRRPASCGIGRGNPAKRFSTP